jgi:hypothetical protein
MSDTTNIHEIYRQERSRWLREEAPRKSLRDVIAESVPYWIILVALVLYGLSAPHAASVFDKLTVGDTYDNPADFHAIGIENDRKYLKEGRKVLVVASNRRLARSIR